MINLLKQYVYDHPEFVTIRNSTTYPTLHVLKYKKRVFYDNKWNNYLENCRGTVVDDEFNPVVFPFTKIYNYGIESRAPRISLKTVVDAYRKINGFMCAVSWYKDDIIVSTTGSLDSSYVALARSKIDLERFRKVCSRYKRHTFIFECVHEDDPHIISEIPGLYLIGYRANRLDKTIKLSPKQLRRLELQFNTIAVEYVRTTLEHLIELTKGIKHEGYVWYDNNGNCAKIKSVYYLIQKAYARSKNISKLNKVETPEEFYPLIDYIKCNSDFFNSISEQQRLEYMRDFLNTNHCMQC